MCSSEAAPIYSRWLLFCPAESGLQASDRPGHTWCPPRPLRVSAVIAMHLVLRNFGTVLLRTRADVAGGECRSPSLQSVQRHLERAAGQHKKYCTGRTNFHHVRSGE